ncbi:hypothetical protein M3J09_002514 [Ascochyta lentis]
MPYLQRSPRRQMGRCSDDCGSTAIIAPHQLSYT